MYIEFHIFVEFYWDQNFFKFWKKTFNFQYFWRGKNIEFESDNKIQSADLIEKGH